MRRSIWWATLLAVFVAVPVFAVKPPLATALAPAPLHAAGRDLPARAPAGFARADTISFGYFQVIDGYTYAVQGETWTFDHGGAALEGWYSIDETTNSTTYWRQITAESWAGHGNQVAAPILAGAGSAWVGAFEDEGDALCWESGLGYGNHWCQRLTSPEFIYTGAGNVHLEFKYFQDSEYKFDYGKVLVLAAGNITQLNGPGGWSGNMNLYTAPLSYTREILPSELGGPGDPRPIQIVFEFRADGGWSDEDGYYTTTYGPMAIDDFAISGAVTSGASYTWDSGLEGWTPDHCPGLGSYMAVHPLSLYSNITFPCGCGLTNNVMAFHDLSFHHPTASRERAFSPPVDRTSYQAYNKIMAEWDQYSDLSFCGIVRYRPGWSYYPVVCPSTGQYVWSGRKGQDVWLYNGDTPVCGRLRNVATDWGIPANCQAIAFVYETYTSCDEIAIPPTCWCAVPTNASPIIDNIRIRMTSSINAPPVALDTGDSYTDGFPMGDVLSVTGLGNANIARTLNVPANAHNDPWRLGDSLVVVGPAPTPSEKWEAKLWFRVKREGPGQTNIAAYRDWRDRVADGRNIVGAAAQFTFGWMDSVETSSVSKVKFDSYFKEKDDDYVPGPPPRPDINESNEIIRDQMLTPGTKIQYFVTSNYTCLPATYYYSPDTTGGSFWDFEILPSYRTDPATGYYRFPCLLYVNAAGPDNRGTVEKSLNMLLHGAPADQAWDLPDPSNWDRYDYAEASSNFHAPMIRNTGGNNGATVAQLMGYRMIMVDTGTNAAGGDCMDSRDWQGLDDWLSLDLCGGNERRQGFYATGDNIAGIINGESPSFLDDRLGVTLICDRYSQAGCPAGKPLDQNYCIRLNTVTGAAWTPGLDLDLYGNWCPQGYGFDVIGATGSGYGNKDYLRIGGGEVQAAQVVNNQSEADENYRSVIDGYDVGHVIERLGEDPNGECLYDSTRALNAAADEIGHVLQWTLDLADPLALGLCIDPCLMFPGDAPAIPADGPVNRLSQNRPNPFNPSTAIHYSLAQAGPAVLVIFDVTGRRVKTLVDRPLAAGPHVAVWDGLDEAGHKVPAGVYWSQLTAGCYTSNKKMVIVR